MAKKKTRDPLEKFDNLNVPGHTTLRRLHNVNTEKNGYWIAMMCGYLMVAFFEFLHLFLISKNATVQLLVMGLPFFAFALYRIRRNRRELESIKLGWKGEVATGYLLEELRTAGYTILHDLETKEKGNIDHVVIGPAGVFAIETKTVSMPVDDKATITVGRENELVIAGLLDIRKCKGRHPMDQARASAAMLARMIEDSSGKRTTVKPVLLYPGWWVNENAQSDVMVMNPKRFISVIRNMPAVLSSAQIQFISKNLIRVQEASYVIDLP
ncbi:MAG: nuclease-related domain-containing protein [Phycisphaeraceae bacterium JB051]